jgi:hypothetical protein
MSASYAIRPRGDIGRAAWDAFVEASNETWLWHRADLIDALATWPDYSDVSFGVFDNHGVLQALMPLHLASRWVGGVIVHWVLTSLGGPACAAGMAAPQRKKLMVILGEELLRLMDLHRAERAEVRLSALTPALRGREVPRAGTVFVTSAKPGLGAETP